MKELQEQIDMLKKAHQRLFNQYNTLEQNYSKLKEYCERITDIVNETNTMFKTEIQELKQSQPKKELVPGNMYSELIDELITQSETIEWKGKNFKNIDIKLKGRNEVYSSFVETKYLPIDITKYINAKVKFEYKDNNKIKINNFI
jgi:hypothetical protein